MGHKQSKPTYSREKLGNSSGIKVMPPTIGAFFREAFTHQGLDDRLIGERKEQIQDQFTDVRLQSEWAEFKKDWAKDGYFTQNNEQAGYFTEANCPDPVPMDEDGNPKCFMTSEDWPDDVKEATADEAVSAGFYSFRSNHNAVLRTYEHFKQLDGAVRNPYAGEERVRPRCYDDPAGSCPEWGKTFKQAYEGELPDDIRDLDGEGLDRFNRFMFQEAQEETLDIALGYTDFIPFTGALLRDARALDKNSQAEWTSQHASIHYPGAEEVVEDLKQEAQMNATLGGVELAVDFVTLGAGGTVVKAASKGANLLIKGTGKLVTTVAGGTIRAGAAGAAGAVEAATVAGGEGVIKAGTTATTDALVKGAVTFGETSGNNVKAALTGSALKAGLESGAITIEEAVTTAAAETTTEALTSDVARGATEAAAQESGEFTAKQFVKEMGGRALLPIADVATGTYLGTKCAADDECWRFTEPHMPEPVINHMPHTEKHPNETVTYSDDLYYSSDPLPADAVTGGSSTTGTGATLILVLMAGGAAYYVYRKLT